MKKDKPLDQMPIQEVHTEGFKTDNVIFASGLAGGVCMLLAESIYYPLDSLKTRMQASNKLDNFVSKANEVSKFRGVSMILGSFPAAFTYFITYESAKQFLSNYDSIDVNLRNSIAGGVSEITQNLILNPFEVIKQNMQIGVSRGIIPIASYIWNRKGLRGFYIGYPALIIREIPYSSIQMPSYEYFRERSRARGENGEVPWWTDFVNGGLASGLGGFFTTPIDVIKTKMMTSGASKTYLNTWHCIVSVARDEGISKFMSAFHLRVFNNAVAGGVFFGFYEKARSALLKESTKY